MKTRLLTLAFFLATLSGQDPPLVFAVAGEPPTLFQVGRLVQATEVGPLSAARCPAIDVDSQGRLLAFCYLNHGDSLPHLTLIDQQSGQLAPLAQLRGEGFPDEFGIEILDMSIHNESLPACPEILIAPVPPPNAFLVFPLEAVRCSHSADSAGWAMVVWEQLERELGMAIETTLIGGTDQGCCSLPENLDSSQIVTAARMTAVVPSREFRLEHRQSSPRECLRHRQPVIARPCRS